MGRSQTEPKPFLCQSRTNSKLLCGTSKGFMKAFMKLFYENFIFKGALSGLRQFLAAESPLKMMKIFFISRQKLFSFSRYLSFCLDFLVM